MTKQKPVVPPEPYNPNIEERRGPFAPVAAPYRTTKTPKPQPSEGVPVLPQSPQRVPGRDAHPPAGS